MANTVVCTIGGTAQEILQDSFSIEHQLGERAVATFTLRKIRPSLFDSVTITIDGTARFGGVVLQTAENGPANGSTYYTTVDAAGWEIYLQKRHVTATYAASSSLKTIVSDIVTDYLTGYGLSLDAGMATGPSMAAQSYTRRSIADVFNELADAAGWTWRITPAGVITWEAAGSSSAPFSITAGSTYCKGKVKVTRDATDYANTITIVAGTTDDPIVESVDDDTEVAAHGILEEVLADSNISDSSGATSLATARLNATVATPVTVEYETDEAGLWPGQKQSIAISARNLTTADYLIQSVEDRSIGDRLVHYTVKATSYCYALQSELATFRSWSGESGDVYSSLIASGPGGITTYDLGGDKIASVSDATPTWVTAANAHRKVINGTTFAGRVVTAKIFCRADAAGVTVTPRVYNVTTSAAAGTSASAVTGTTWTKVEFVLTLAAGDNVYELQVLPGTANIKVFAYGYVEAH